MKTAILVLAVAGLGVANDKTKTVVRVVDADVVEKQVSVFIPGIPGSSTTSCTGTATAIGAGPMVVATGQSDCTTGGYSGMPAHTATGYISFERVRAIMQDGRHVVLACRERLFSACKTGLPGTYGADVDGYAVWINMPDLSGRSHRIKYQLVGTWSEPPTPAVVPSSDSEQQRKAAWEAWKAQKIKDQGNR